MRNAHVCVCARTCACMHGVHVRERGRERKGETHREREEGGEGKAWVLRGKANYALEGGMRRPAGRQLLPASQFPPGRILAHSPGINWSLSGA